MQAHTVLAQNHFDWPQKINVLSRFANMVGQFPNFFLKNELYKGRVSNLYVWRLKEEV